MKKLLPLIIALFFAVNNAQVLHASGETKPQADEFYMKAAIAEAKKNLEYPFGQS